MTDLCELRECIKDTEQGELCEDAIEEIERLRNELKYQKKCAQIAEEVIVGTSYEGIYIQRMKEEGMYDD